MGYQLQRPGCISVGYCIEQICLCFAPSDPDYGGNCIFADFSAPTLDVTGELVQLPRQLMKVAPDRSLQKLNCWFGDSDSERARGMVRNPPGNSVTG